MHDSGVIEAEDAGSGTRPIRRRQVAAAVIGNALEFYDFTTYTLFAVEVGRAFFPFHTAFENLMLSLLTFAVGFIGRPLGGAVIGAIGDRAGRRPAMLLSFSLMGLGIAGVVCIPPYAAIGPLAPALLVLCRLVQGFALGGEVGPTTAFLVEAAAPGRRGLIGCWQSASQSIASLAGASVGLMLSYLLSQAQLDAFGWRIAFGVGAVVLPLGLWLRRGLPETLHQPEADAPAARPAARPMLSRAKPIVLGLGMILSFTTSTYVLLYMTTYAADTLRMGKDVSFAASVANGVAGVIFTLLGGVLSDRFGRRPVMVGARTLFLLSIWPAFTLMVASRSPVAVILGTGVMSAFSSASVGVAIVALTESFRKGFRSTGMAVIYAVGVAAFGGIAQPSVKWLLHVTGDPMSPAWYMMGAALIGIVAMALMPETRPARQLAARH